MRARTGRRQKRRVFLRNHNKLRHAEFLPVAPFAPLCRGLRNFLRLFRDLRKLTGQGSGRETEVTLRTELGVGARVLPRVVVLGSRAVLHGSATQELP